MPSELFADADEMDLLSPRPSTKNSAEMESAEEQILSNIRDVRYIVREYPTEVVVQKYLKGRSSDENDIFVPDYQRDLVWPEKNQSRFIESLLIGLPIPFLFVADVSADESPEKAGRLEIVDGVQRIRTLSRFMTGDLVLSNLERLTQLNGFTFFDLHPSRQRRFGRTTMRMIELTETVAEDVRREMFDRINSGSVGLEAVEIRRGMEPGPFLELTTELAADSRLQTLAPVSEAMRRRFEYEELVTRFFAFLDNYTEYGLGGKVVKDFLLAYVKEANLKLNDDPSQKVVMASEWDRMLSFVEANLPEGFKKTGPGRKVPRVRFEAISVGIGLALRERPGLIPPSTAWLNSPEFKKWTTSDASNNRANLVGRIEFVRDRLLGKE
jgi:hypothetical protein